jgi:5-carboxymethyl-2-hydroxymuconate isomerase
MASQQKRGRQQQSRQTRNASRHSADTRASTVYKDFIVYDKSKAPLWHPIKKMRYVFFRMIGGTTVTDALAEIKWNASEFWHLVDLKRHSVFREEYKRAKLLQGRAFADAVHTIAEGRDPISRRALRRLEKIVARALGKAGRQKSSLAVKAIMDGILSTIDVNDKGIVARNKLQMDAAKWIAKTANPSEFGDKSAVALGAPDGEGNVSKSLPLVIQFVGPDGKVVMP